MKELAALAYRDTTAENREFWKNEMGQALREIQQIYDEKMDVMRGELEAYYNLKVYIVNIDTPRMYGVDKSYSFLVLTPLKLHWFCMFLNKRLWSLLDITLAFSSRTALFSCWIFALFPLSTHWGLRTCIVLANFFAYARLSCREMFCDVMLSYQNDSWFIQWWYYIRWWLVLGWVTTKEDHPRQRIA